MLLIYPRCRSGARRYALYPICPPTHCLLNHTAVLSQSAALPGPAGVREEKRTVSSFGLCGEGPSPAKPDLSLPKPLIAAVAWRRFILSGSGRSIRYFVVAHQVMAKPPGRRQARVQPMPGQLYYRRRPIAVLVFRLDFNPVSLYCLAARCFFACSPRCECDYGPFLFSKIRFGDKAWTSEKLFESYSVNTADPDRRPTPNRQAWASKRWFANRPDNEETWPATYGGYPKKRRETWSAGVY